MVLVSRTFLLVIASLFALVTVAIGQVTDATSISYNLGRFANPDSMTRASVFRSKGGVVRSTRGVLFQARAGFARFDPTIRDWRKVPENQILLMRSTEGYCLKIASAPCAALPFSAAEMRAIAAFAKRRDGRAMSLATDARTSAYRSQIEAELTAAGLMKVDGRIRPQIWVAREFAPYPRLVFLLEILDLADIFSADIKQQELERYRQTLNRTLAGTQSSGKLVDWSWLVSDVGANLVLLHENGRLRCAGYPTRASWQIRVGSSHAYITEVEALQGTEALPRNTASLDTLLHMKGAQLATELDLQGAQLATVGRALICTTGALRSLYRYAPARLTGL